VSRSGTVAGEESVAEEREREQQQQQQQDQNALAVEKRNKNQKVCAAGPPPLRSRCSKKGGFELCAFRDQQSGRHDGALVAALALCGR